MAIRLFPPVLINRIAAGEVIERPAAAVKELVENAIDAGARYRHRAARRAASLIAVADNGAGMTAEELALAVERHCTSKLPDDDLCASPRSAFAARPCRRSARSAGCASSRGLRCRECLGDHGRGRERSAPLPAAHPSGTRVEVRDLFFATPARLKFLKTPRTERDLAVDTVGAWRWPIPTSPCGEAKRSASCCGLPRPQSQGDLSGGTSRALLGREFAEPSARSTPSAAAFG